MPISCTRRPQPQRVNGVSHSYLGLHRLLPSFSDAMASADRKRVSRKRAAAALAEPSPANCHYDSIPPSSSSSSSCFPVVREPDADAASGDAALGRDVLLLPSVKSDVLIDYGGQQFQLHSQYLQHNCSLFAGMTEPASEWGSLCLNGIPQLPAEVFGACMRLLYEPAELGDWVSAAEIEELLAVLRLSSHLGFAALTDACVAALPGKIMQLAAPSKLGSERLSVVWCLASEPRLRKLRQAVLTVIARDIKAFGYPLVHQHLSSKPMWAAIQKDELLFILHYNTPRGSVNSARFNSAAVPDADNEVEY